jgi:hypothetical protein
MCPSCAHDFGRTRSVEHVLCASCCVVLVFAALGMVPRAVHMLGKHFVSEPHPVLLCSLKDTTFTFNLSQNSGFTLPSEIHEQWQCGPLGLQSSWPCPRLAWPQEEEVSSRAHCYGWPFPATTVLVVDRWWWQTNEASELFPPFSDVGYNLTDKVDFNE